MKESSEHNANAANEAKPHVSSVGQLLGVYGALAVLTVLTVAVTRVDLGSSLNLWIAMLIATIKASLVALFFMHLRYEKPFIRVIFIGVLLFVFLMTSVIMMDTINYKPNLIPGYAPEMQNK